MLTASSQKKIIRSKQSHDLTNAADSRMAHVRSQQNLLEKTIVDEAKIEQNILKEIEQAKQIISKYSSEISTKTPSTIPPVSNHECILSLYELEKIIEAKNAEINLISEQIKGLKSSPYDAYKDSNFKYKTVKNLQLYRLSDEIVQQKDQLLQLHKQHQKKKKQLNENRRIMKQTVDAHINLLSTGSKRITSFQEFVSKRKEKEKQQPEDSNHKSKRLSKKNPMNIKQTAESDEQKKNIVVNSNNLTEVQNKRRVAQMALRTAKKKHQDLINQLTSKLEFLKDENEQLDELLEKKNNLLKDAELKFSQKQQNPQPKKLMKMVRYSEPQL